MNTKVHPSAPRLAPVHALSAAHAHAQELGRSPPGAQAGAVAPGQFRGFLFRSANPGARLPLLARGRRNSEGVRGRSAARQGDEGGFGIGDDEADKLGDFSAEPVDTRGGNRDESASDDARRQEHRFAAASFSAGGSDAAAEVAAVPEWAAAALAEGGLQALLLRLTQRLMCTIDAAQTAPTAHAGPLHPQILGDMVAVLQAAGDRPLDIGGWLGMCVVLREASRMRGHRPSQPTDLVRRLNLMLPLLLYHVTRPRTPALRAVLLARIGLACRTHPASPREVTHEP